MPSAIPLRCTVRGCGRELVIEGSQARCAAKHSFDRSRRGIFNLLQPQDKASANPGDSREVVEARRRTVDAGWVEPLRDALVPRVVDQDVLDVGCGEGFVLGSLVAAGCRGVGVDLSTPAIELAHRRWPKVQWLVVNADRGLPVVTESVDVVLSVTARRQPEEFRRVLRPGGRVFLVVAGDEDLCELREGVLGRSTAKDRASVIVQAFEPYFALQERFSVRGQRIAEPDVQVDLWAGTYRGARATQHMTADRLLPRPITFDWEVWVWA